MHNYTSRVGLLFVLLVQSCKSGEDNGVDASGATGGTGGDAADEAAAPAAPFVVLASGDIAMQGGKAAETAKLIKQLMSEKPVRAVLAIGDLAYYNGTPEEFMLNYHTTWGDEMIRAITRPVPGNHEYFGEPTARGYFDYWLGLDQQTGAFGDRGAGFYSYDIGDWHFVALNSSNGCNPVGCGPGSPQHEFLKQDLEKNKKTCTLAYWHHPRFNQGKMYGSMQIVAPFWDALYDARADLVLSGHEHNIQQFGPMNKQGVLDTEAGIRSFVVGTGGAANFYPNFSEDHADAAEFKDAATHGVLELTLHPDRYEWRFVSIAGNVLVSGQDTCR